MYIYLTLHIHTLTFRSLYVTPRATDSDRYYRVSFGIRNLGSTKGKYEVDKKRRPWLKKSLSFRYYIVPWLEVLCITYM